MYTECYACEKPLGRNTGVKSLDVGRTIMFDPMWYRVWVGCGHCGTWNLAPEDDALVVDELVRLYDASAARHTEDDLGIAVGPDDVQLVRVGPVRSFVEFAGAVFAGELRRRRVSRSGILLASYVVPHWGLPYAYTLPYGGVIGLALTALMPVIFWIWLLRPIHRAPNGRGGTTWITFQNAFRVKLVTEPDGRVRLQVRRFIRKASLEGEAMIEALAAILPRVNVLGGTRGQVDRAIRLVAEVGGPDAMLEHAAWPRHLMEKATKRQGAYPSAGKVSSLPRVVGLALELATRDRAARAQLAARLETLRKELGRAQDVADIGDGL